MMLRHSPPFSQVAVFSVHRLSSLFSDPLLGARGANSVRFITPCRGPGAEPLQAGWRDGASQIAQTQTAAILAVWQSLAVEDQEGLAGAVCVALAAHALFCAAKTYGGPLFFSSPGQMRTSPSDRSMLMDADREMVLALIELDGQLHAHLPDPPAVWPEAWKALVGDSSWRELLLERMESRVEQLARHEPPLEAVWIALRLRAMADSGSLSRAIPLLQKLLALPEERRAGLDWAAVWLSLAQTADPKRRPELVIPWLVLSHPDGAPWRYVLSGAGNKLSLEPLNAQPDGAQPGPELPAAAVTGERLSSWRALAQMLLESLVERAGRDGRGFGELIPVSQALATGSQASFVWQALLDLPRDRLLAIEQQLVDRPQKSGVSNQVARTWLNSLQLGMQERLQRDWEAVQQHLVSLDDPALQGTVSYIAAMALMRLDDPREAFAEMDRGLQLRQTLAHPQAPSSSRPGASWAFEALWQACEEPLIDFLEAKLDPSMPLTFEGLERQMLVMRLRLTRSISAHLFPRQLSQMVVELGVLNGALPGSLRHVSPARRGLIAAICPQIALALLGMHERLGQWQRMLRTTGLEQATSQAYESTAFHELRAAAALATWRGIQLQALARGEPAIADQVENLVLQLRAVGRSLRHGRQTALERWGWSGMVARFQGDEFRLRESLRRVWARLLLRTSSPLQALDWLARRSGASPSGEGLRGLTCPESPKEWRQLWTLILETTIARKAFGTAAVMLLRVARGHAIWSDQAESFCATEWLTASGPLAEQLERGERQWPRLQQVDAEALVGRLWGTWLKAYLSQEGGIRAMAEEANAGAIGMQLELMRRLSSGTIWSHLVASCRRELFASRTALIFQTLLRQWGWEELADDLAQRAIELDCTQAPPDAAGAELIEIDPAAKQAAAEALTLIETQVSAELVEPFFEG